MVLILRDKKKETLPISGDREWENERRREWMAEAARSSRWRANAFPLQF
jgi:hypothetical protein